MMEHAFRRVAVVGGARTPFAKAGAQLREYPALELATHAVNGAIENTGLDPQVVDELAYGSVIVDPSIPHLARELNFRSDLPAETRAVTLTDNCITGTSAIQSVYNSIVLGRASVGIAGGVESMSNPPVMYTPAASRIFLEASRAWSFSQRVRALAKLRPRHLKPWSYGIEEPSTGLTMGQHTEITVKEWQITRKEQDEIAYRSHVRAHAATQDGRLKEEISPLDGVDHDTLVRPSTSIEALAKLRPVFDRSDAGTITAGNSSPLTDGAAAAVLMAEDRALELGIEPLAFIRDFVNVGIDPDDGLLMGPGVAVPRLLERNGLTLVDVDLIEMHEAFAGQVASNLKAWELGWKEPAIGPVDPAKLNQLGSSIAVGHPFAATGARIVTTLSNEMTRRDARYGVISICGAGATAVAMLLERT